MNSPSEKTRLDYLDAVRAFALILGVVFHASISFMPIFIGWAVMDVSASPAVPVFMMVSHSFRLEIFFLVAGFFSHMTFHGKGIQVFVASRLMRIAIPFVIGWFLLRPLLVSAWTMGAESMRGEADILNSFKTGFASLGELPSNLFIGTHLWFLYYLLLITLGLLVLRYLLGMHKSIQRRLTQLIDMVTNWVSSSRLAIFAVSVPTAACHWFMTYWGVDTPDQTLVPHIPVLLIYGGFFFFGWMLHRQAHMIGNFVRLSWDKFSLCLLAVIITAVLAGFARNAGHPQYILLKLSFALSHSIMMWSLVSLTIGLCKRFFDRPGKMLRYIADASYWLYLIHLPIVVWLQIAFAELSIHWSIKLVLISAVTVTVSILLYDLFIRSSFVGAVLNGKRRPRLLFRFGKPDRFPVNGGDRGLVHRAR